MQKQEFVQQVISKYSTDLVHGYKALYKPGENITIVLESGNYLADLPQLQLLFRPVYTGASGASAVKPEDLFTLSDLTINQISLKGHSEHEGRGLAMNFMSSLRSKDTIEEPMTASNDLAYTATGYAPTIVPLVNVDKMHMYSPIGATFSESFGPYQRNMQRRAKHAQKYFTYAESGVGVISVAANASAKYNYESVRLIDIAPELLHLGQVSMIDKTIRIDLQLTPKEKVLTLALNGVKAAVDSSLPADSNYTIVDVCTYFRMLQIKPSMVMSVKQQFMTPIQQITYVQQSQAFSGSVLNLKTSLQHRHILGAIVFFQLANKTGASVTQEAQNYNSALVVDNGLVHYYHDSYKIDTTSIYVEVGGKRFKQSDIPINNKQQAAFINAQNSLSELFSGRQMSDPLCDFVQNKYAHVIPISPQAFDDDFVANSTQANLHIEVSDTVRNGTLSLYKATVVYLCMQSIIPTESGVRLER